jgi:hypothetical protein
LLLNKTKSKIMLSRIQEAANIRLRLGDIKQFCELSIDLGRWEKAIAVAPAVSIEYWKSLSSR